MYYIIYICNKILLVSHPSPKIGIYWNSCSEVRPRQLFWWPNFREAALQKSGFPLSLSLSSPSKAFLPGWAHVATTLCPLPPSIQGGGVNMQSATSGYESNESNCFSDHNHATCWYFVKVRVAVREIKTCLDPCLKYHVGIGLFPTHCNRLVTDCSALYEHVVGVFSIAGGEFSGFGENMPVAGIRKYTPPRGGRWMEEADDWQTRNKEWSKLCDFAK